MSRRLVITFSILCSSISWANDSLFIYSNGYRVYAVVDSSRVLINWRSTVDTTNLEEVLIDFPNLDRDSYSRNIINGFYLHKLSGNYDYDTVIHALETDNRTVRVNRVLKVNERSSILIGDEIVCKFKPEIERHIIDSLVTSNGIEILTESEYVKNQFVLRVTESSPNSTLDAANLLYELEETDWSHPNFVGNLWADGYVVEDFYYLADQWNVARAVDHISSSNHGAWEITRGNQSVITAVLDFGMELHEDFDSTLWDGGFDFVNMDFDPSPINPEPESLNESHGMQVLGLIAAMHNNEIGAPPSMANKTQVYYSVAGVSPGVRVFPARIFNEFGEGVTPDRVALAIMVAKNVDSDVINCSWGYDDVYPDVVRDAIDSALFNGRNGKGCIVVASVGNSPAYPIHPPAAQDSVISVGAITSYDLPFTYNNQGIEMDLLAPSSNVSLHGPVNPVTRFSTVDRQAGFGSNPKMYDSCFTSNDLDYSCSFGGTSGAAPLVSGVVGLLLSVDSSLTRDQVQEILRASAVKVLSGDTIDVSDIPYYGYGRVSGVRALSSVLRGDMDGNPGINNGDLNYMVNYIFRGGPPPFPDKHFGDVNCDSNVNVQDLLYLNKYLNQSGPPPPNPCLEFKPGF